jgi:hypothetical protein
MDRPSLGIPPRYLSSATRVQSRATSVAATPTELRVFRAIGRGIRRAAIKGSLPGANLR